MLFNFQGPGRFRLFCGSLVSIASRTLGVKMYFPKKVKNIPLIPQMIAPA